uniref:Uncharacterized protein n=1 Tax=Anguilla anguilla TaxID=7936 RepID=A0A0E9TPG8_ANGAN
MSCRSLPRKQETSVLTTSTSSAAVHFNIQ